MSRRHRQLLIGSLMLLYLLAVPYAAVHLDMSRDILTAWRILEGTAYPTFGPIFAGTFRLGPIWYYLLAAALWITHSWYGTMMLLGCLCALQMPLAYLTGKALHGRGAGMFWAVLLLLPTWSTFEQLLPSHTQLTTPLALATLLSMLRYYRTRKSKYLIASGLAFGLALHAHPTTMALAFAGVVMLVWSIRTGTLAWRALAAAGLLAILPFAPFLLDEMGNGFPNLRAVGTYLQADRTLGSIAAAPSILIALVYAGPHYWLATMLGWPAHWATAAASGLTLVIGIGALGFLHEWRRSPSNRVLTAAALTTLMSFGLIALISEATTFYMTTILRVMLFGLIATGLATVARSHAGSRILPLASAGIAIAFITVIAGTANMQTRGAWPFSFLPLFNVKSTAAPVTSMISMLPAYAMAPSGQFLCANAPLAIHGEYAAHVLLNYGVEARIECGVADAVVGGAQASRQHWAGFPRNLLKAAGLQSEQRVGPIGLFRVDQIFGPQQAHVLAIEPIYPPIHLASGAPSTFVHDIGLRDGDWLAVTNLNYALSAKLDVSLRMDDSEFAPRAQDLASTLYFCDGCAGGQTRNAKVSVTTNDHDHVDIVRFRAP